MALFPAVDIAWYFHFARQLWPAIFLCNLNLLVNTHIIKAFAKCTVDTFRNAKCAICAIFKELFEDAYNMWQN